MPTPMSAELRSPKNDVRAAVTACHFVCAPAGSLMDPDLSIMMYMSTGKRWAVCETAEHVSASPAEPSPTPVSMGI